MLREFVPFDADTIEAPMRELATTLGLKVGQLFGIIRNAVTGKMVSPPLFGSIQALGLEQTLKRLENAEDVLVAHITAETEG